MNRKGSFDCIYPAPDTKALTKFLETPSYKDILLSEWVNQEPNALKRISRLRKELLKDKNGTSLNSNLVNSLEPLSTAFTTRLKIRKT